jgi:cell pole-organizing protein PopZ
MGDISTEPSMEEILSSIKRIIAEEGDAATGSRTRRAAKPVAPATREIEPENDEILELSEPAPDVSPPPLSIGAPDVPHHSPAPAAPEPILSDRAAEATRGPLEALSRMVVRPETPSPVGETLEAMVRELLKPMLREWLDDNLPQIVETMVAREIARITGRKSG